MGRPVQKLSTKSSNNEAYHWLGVFMYPSFSELPPELSSRDIGDILGQLRDKSFIRQFDDYVNFMVGGITGDRSGNFLYNRDSEFFFEIIESINGMVPLISCTDNPILDNIFPPFGALERFARYNESAVRELFERISGEGRDSDLDILYLKRILHTIFDHDLNAILKPRRPSIGEAYNYLINKTGRRNWIERKYAPNKSNKKIRVVISTNGFGNRATSEVHLCAIDDRIEMDIIDGNYHNIPYENIKMLGDYIIGIDFLDLYHINKRVKYTVNDLFDEIDFIYYFLKGQPVNINRYRNISREFDLRYLGNYIEKEKIEKLDSSLAELSKAIDAYARDHPGQPIADIALKAFRRILVREQQQNRPLHGEEVFENNSGRYHIELSHSVKQPVLWKDRHEKSRGQDPIPFLRENYATELRNGMTLGELRVADPSLGMAVSRWAETHQIPTDLNLDMRTRKQRNDERLADLERAQNEGQTAEIPKHQMRLLKQAQYRRKQER